MPKDQSEKNYRTQQYRPVWEVEAWAKGWLERSKENPIKARCKLCKKDLVPGKSELQKHTKTTDHIKNTKAVQSSSSLINFVSVTSDAQVKAELNIVAMITRNNISLRFSDALLSTVKHCFPDSKIAHNITCGRTKTTYLLTECLFTSAHSRLVDEMSKSDGFSILCDKATEITLKKVYCVNVRFSINGSIISKLYRLIELKEGGDTDALFTALTKILHEDNLSWRNVIGYASDGENLMQGTVHSVMTEIKKEVPDIYILKCYCNSFHLVS